MKDLQVRVSPRTHKQLKVKAAQKGMTIKKLIEVAVALV